MYSGWVTGGAHYLILTPYRTHLPSVSSVCCDLSGIVLFCLYFLKGKRIKWKLKPVSWTTLPYFQLLNLYFSRRDSLNIKFLLSGFLFFVFNFTPSSFHDCSVRKLVLTVLFSWCCSYLHQGVLFVSGFQQLPWSVLWYGCLCSFWGLLKSLAIVRLYFFRLSLLSSWHANCMLLEDWLASLRLWSPPTRLCHYFTTMTLLTFKHSTLTTDKWVCSSPA